MIASLALAAAVTASCSWDSPGANRFTGDTVAAVDTYTDIPVATREKLKSKMAKYRYDDVAAITKDSIKGKSEYTDLRDMHFGGNKVCTTVTRQKWKPEATERGLVYCADGHCLIVPTVCSNVSRVTKLQPVEPPKPAEGGGGPVAGGGGIVFPMPPLELPPVDTPDIVIAPVPPAPVWMGSTLGPGVSWAYPNPYPVYHSPPTIINVHEVPAVPEPGTWALLLAGLAAIFAFKRRK